MTEWLKVPVLKTGRPATVSRVRIPPSPPCTVRYMAPPTLLNPLFFFISTVHGSATNCYNRNMYYVYVLLSSKDNNFYIGFTSDLKKRYSRHEKGDVTATKNRRPVTLVFYEAYVDKYDALRREKYLKSSKGHTTLRAMLKEYLEKNLS